MEVTVTLIYRCLIGVIALTTIGIFAQFTLTSYGSRRTIHFNRSYIRSYRMDSFNMTYAENVALISGRDNEDSSPLCGLQPKNLVGHIAVNLTPPSIPWLETQHPELLPGGLYRPKGCRARSRMAVIVAYRGRPNLLAVFLKHMHTLLQRQEIEYAIYVVEMAMPTLFNRGMLMNVGFVEANRLHGWQCFALHDVDMYPEDDRNLYSCPEAPQHLSRAIDNFHYKMPYKTYFGGVCSFSKEHYHKINGFSNRFFGWGGEDDDLYTRVVNRGLRVIHYPDAIARYTTYKHKHEKSNAANPERFQMLRYSRQMQPLDGLNSLKYKLLKLEKKKLYTWIYIKVNRSEIIKDGLPNTPDM